MHPCPSDSSFFAYALVCAAFMAIGFTSIIALASELVSRETFKKKEDRDV